MTNIKSVLEKESELLDYVDEGNFDSKSAKIVLDSIDEKYGLDINKVANKIFNKTTKKLRKFLMEMFDSNEPDISVLNIIKILSSSLNLNVDLILNHYSRVERSSNVRFLTVAFTKELLKIYKEERVIKILLQDRMALLSDTIYMFKKVKEERNVDFLPSNASSIKEIHDSLERMMKKLSSKNFDLEQRDDILKLDDTLINENLQIRVPKTHYDLIDLGEDLNFCIGNGYYSRSVKDGESSIVSIYKNDKPLYGIQFNRYAISNAYGFDNEVLPNDVLLAIQKALVSEPKVPDDFIAITDSTWINGFKYNDKDLYIMMNYKVYVYYDVEKDVYEDLITSTRKGSYVNQIIKGNYKSRRIE